MSKKIENTKEKTEKVFNIKKKLFLLKLKDLLRRTNSWQEKKKLESEAKDVLLEKQPKAKK